MATTKKTAAPDAEPTTSYAQALAEARARTAELATIRTRRQEAMDRAAKALGSLRRNGPDGNRISSVGEIDAAARQPALERSSAPNSGTIDTGSLTPPEASSPAPPADTRTPPSPPPARGKRANEPPDRPRG